MRRRTALWALAAVLGLAIAAGISWATSTLTSQHIGLASEPVTAGRSLAPAETTREKTSTATPAPAPSGPATTTAATTETTPPTVPAGAPPTEAEPTGTQRTGEADDSSAGGRGRDD